MTDLVRTMLVTGVRLGELLALDGTAFDAHGLTVATDWRIIRITGRGKDGRDRPREAGLPSGAGADQFGNTRAGTEKHYIARRERLVRRRS